MLSSVTPLTVTSMTRPPIESLPIARLGTAYFERTAGFVVGFAGGVGSFHAFV